MVNDHNYDVIEFPIAKKDYCQMEQKNNICINIFRYEMIWFILFMYQIKKIENYMDLLLITDENNSHYM